METIKKIRLFDRLVLFVFIFILLSIMFLFALNGRYMHIGNSLIIDKWKKEAIYPISKELPLIENGKISN